jgi:hypothetical protein
MMRDLILYRSNQIAKKTIQFGVSDYALASLYLDIDITTLREMNSKIEPISLQKANELKKLKTFTTFDNNGVYQKFEDNTFLFWTKRTDWVSLVFLYVIDVSPEPDVSALSKFCRKKLDLFREARMLAQTHQRESYELRLKYAGNFPIFKLAKLQKACKELKIECERMENGRIALTWKDVKMGSDAQGYVIYSRIILLIDTLFKVQRYMIAFKEFYYDSEWGVLEFPLHPNIDGDIFNYGRNHHLEWLDTSNYDMMTKAYDELIREYHDYSLQTPVQISHTYRKLREVWGRMNPDLAYKVKAEKLFKDILSLPIEKTE